MSQQPEPPWEAQTESEKVAYAAGWYKSLEVQASTVNLTDEQISDLWHQSGQQPFKFARMIQKALGR